MPDGVLLPSGTRQLKSKAGGSIMNHIDSIGINAGPNAPSWEKRVRLKTVRFSPSTLLAALLAIPLIAAPFSASAQEKKVKGTVLEQVDLGNLPAGRRTMRMTLLELQP